MISNSEFSNKPKSFWATVRTVSQAIGYTVKGQGKVKVPSIEEIEKAFKKLQLNSEVVLDKKGNPTQLSEDLIAYYQYRANALNNFVEPRLMDAKRAKAEFNKLKKHSKYSCPLPMNKQKGKKKAPAYLTGIINMIIESNSEGLPCDFDPRTLTTVTKNSKPLRTLARRVDGAFPNAVNPVSIWEIKEYYYTTTFGSRIADGVYETLLDGMELEELLEHENIKVFHVLIIDAHYTWWKCGKSYLCRIIDMLNMGYVDEVLFGYEVLERLPKLVKDWVKIVRSI